MKNAVQTIQTLRELGFRVNVTHYRYPLPVTHIMFSIKTFHQLGHIKREGTRTHPLVSSLGGKTVVTILDQNDRTIGYGDYFFDHKSHYVKKLGLQKAMGRAISSIKRKIKEVYRVKQ